MKGDVRTMRSSSSRLLTRLSSRRLFSSQSQQQVVATTASGSPVLVSETLAKESHAAATCSGDDGTFSGDLTGLRVWESCPYLIRYLDRHKSRLIEGRTVLDVGSGTGAVGLAAAAFGAKVVVLTDSDSEATVSSDAGGWSSTTTLELLRQNVALNRELADKCEVEELRWGHQRHMTDIFRKRPGGFQTIVGSDLLYYKPEETYDALARTVRWLAADDCSLIFSWRVRHGDEHRFVDDFLLQMHEKYKREGAEGSALDGPQFEIVDDGRANEASQTEASHATRVVELRTFGWGPTMPLRWASSPQPQ